MRTADTFHLDAELKKLGNDATIEYLEGRLHFEMNKCGLGNKITDEMYEVAHPKSVPAKK